MYASDAIAASAVFAFSDERMKKITAAQTVRKI
jgi:hypothetical protein